MKASETEFEFPLFTFAPPIYDTAADRDELTTTLPQFVKDGRHIGMEIVDSRRERWVVRSMQTNGRARRWGFWDIVLCNPPPWRVEFDTEKLEPISLDELKDRICRDWHECHYGECEVHGELDQFDAEIAKIRAAPDVPHLYRAVR